ncbi:MAG: hypothetical protein EZS28_013692 [Streblomastix strix]|uniref:Uncharacterized protein n=1 Tax=Streblomastix strix TaxID=222440 RepID=A0A5J4W7C8_9EUKA|nr:MAG: hypothetical protein EZS28_013692 [Streblomastix strix]
MPKSFPSILTLAMANASAYILAIYCAVKCYIDSIGGNEAKVEADVTLDAVQGEEARDALSDDGEEIGAEGGSEDSGAQEGKMGRKDFGYSQQKKLLPLDEDCTDDESNDIFQFNKFGDN